MPSSPRHIPLCLRRFPLPSERLPRVSQIRWSLDSQLISKVLYFSFQLFFPVHIDDVFAPQPVVDCPRKIGIPEPHPLRRRHSCDSKEAKACHGQEGICKFECLECHLALHEYRQASESMIEVMRLSISLHDVCAFFIVDILDAAPGVRADALSI